MSKSVQMAAFEKGSEARSWNYPCHEVHLLLPLFFFLRTQTRPAIEFVSVEESLRPKSYYIVFSFVEYAFTDALKYVKAPGSFCGAEES